MPKPAWTSRHLMICVAVCAAILGLVQWGRRDVWVGLVALLFAFPAGPVAAVWIACRASPQAARRFLLAVPILLVLGIIPQLHFFHHEDIAGGFFCMGFGWMAFWVAVGAALARRNSPSSGL